MLKRFYLFSLVLLCSLMTAWAADEVTVSPVLDVNFRTASGNTAWNSGFPKSAADDGNTDFELTYGAGLFALQKYTVAGLKDATKLVLTLTVGSKNGVDAVKVWPFANNTWTAASGVDDIVGLVTTTTGVAPRATEGTPNTPPITGTKVANSDPAKATFTITGAALATIKANATEDGTFTLLLTNNDLLNGNNKRSYLSINSTNDEANRPSLTATIETVAKTAKIGDTEYATLADAFAAAVAADADAEIQVSGDQKLTSRLTWNKAHTLTITPTKDITIKGPKNAMWFLVNTNNATLNIGSNDYKITLDGIGDDRSSFSNVDVARRENTTYLNLTNIVFKDFTCGANHLVSCKNSGGAITLENITMTNSSSSHALIDNQRVANDALILKGYLNIGDDCTGTHINNVANLKNDGTVEGRIKVDDDNFTASKVLTINWVSSDAEKDVYVANTSVVVGVTSGDIAKCFALTGTDWTLSRVNNDLKLVAPVVPTAQIGETKYADLVAAMAAVKDGETITLLDDQELSARINVKNMSVTIDGAGKTIKRATTYTNGLLFLTQKPDEEMTTALTLQNVTIDGQNVETSAAVIEAGNAGTTTTLNNITIQNVVTTANAAVVNKSGGKLVMKGTIAIPSVFVGTGVVADASEATIASAITLTTDANRPYGIIVEGGKTTDFTCETFRLSQQMDGVYAMPLPQALTVAHPALLHTSADIEAVKARLTAGEALATAAYTRLEAQSGGQAAGAVEYLKRMDKGNWEVTYPDYNNFTAAATDAKLAYELALRYQLKGSDAAANAAVAILNNWATVNKGMLRLTGYANNIPDPNEYLINIQAYQFANAAELLRGYNGWQAADQTKFKNWIRQTFADVAILFLENHHNNKNTLHYWLNWDLACQNALLSVGILCEDKSLVDYAINYATAGEGTGKAANAIVATHNDTDSEETLAQCQESGRDQGHATLDVTLLGVLCQTAQNSGANTDLWTTYKALEMAEYVGKYNLKDATTDAYVYETVPFTTYNNGDVEHTAISADARGTVRPNWELMHAYAKANNKADKYTEAWVKYQRAKNAYGEAEGTSTDELGFGSLMFGAEVSEDVKPTITIKVKDAEREYGAENPAFEYEIDGGTAADLGGEIEITCTATKASGAGTYSIQAHRGSATYENLAFTDATLTVKKAALTISVGTYTVEQGKEMPAFKAAYTGFKNDDTEESLTTKPTLSTTVTSTDVPGEYTVTASGAEAANYEITYQAGTLTITQAKAITIKVKSVEREYGDENPAFDYEIEGGTAADLGGEIAITCEATKTSGVGEYAIKAAKGTATYPNLVFVDGTLTVTKAALTISAGTYTVEQGKEMPAFKAAYTGFKNGDTEESLTTKPTLSTTATSTNVPGEYAVTASGAESANYDITYQAGTLTITPTTAIINIRAAEAEGNVYDLNGRPVKGNLVKGIYIINGKKVMVK